jgi:hypothetical protein
MPDDLAFADYNTRRGAEAVAAAVRAYWTERGCFSVQTWIESGPFKGSEYTHPYTLWCVRSNLVNGLPPARSTA